jgi:hypothetical protein
VKKLVVVELCSSNERGWSRKSRVGKALKLSSTRSGEGRRRSCRAVEDEEESRKLNRRVVDEEEEEELREDEGDNWSGGEEWVLSVVHRRLDLAVDVWKDRLGLLFSPPLRLAPCRFLLLLECGDSSSMPSCTCYACPPACRMACCDERSLIVGGGRRAQRVQVLAVVVGRGCGMDRRDVEISLGLATRA